MDNILIIIHASVIYLIWILFNEIEETQRGLGEKILYPSTLEIDTVELKGQGFTRVAQEGQQVKTGDTIIEFDLAFLQSNAKSTLTPVVISNMDDVKSLTKLSGPVTLGETPVLRIKK